MRHTLLIFTLCTLSLCASAHVHRDRLVTHHSSGFLPVAALSIGYLPISSRDGHIIVYPNPATDRIYIKGDAEAIYKIELINMLGAVVLSTEIINGTVSITDLQAGVYIVKIYAADGALSLSSKLTKQ